MSVALEVQEANPPKPIVIIKPFWWVKALIYRFWWHTKAYSAILGIAILVSLSFVVLYLQGLSESRKLQAKRNHAIEKI